MKHIIALLLISSCLSEVKDIEKVDLRTGQKLYELNCQHCHGEFALGGKYARFNLGQREVAASSKEFLETVNKGKSGTLMSGFSDKLGPNQIESIRMAIEGWKNGKEAKWKKEK